MEDLIVNVEYIKDSIALIKAEGYIDTVTVPEIEKKVQEVVSKKIFQLIVDLKDINYVSSAGWGVFVSEIKDIRNNGGDLMLIGMSPEVYDVYELMEFSSILKSFGSLNEALIAFGITDYLAADLVDPSLGAQKSENQVEAPNTAPAAEPVNNIVDAPISVDSNFTIEEKIQKIIINNPEVDGKAIRQQLKTDVYGNEVVGFFSMRKMLSKLKLDSSDKRKLFAQNH